MRSDARTVWSGSVLRTRRIALIVLSCSLITRSCCTTSEFLSASSRCRLAMRALDSSSRADGGCSSLDAIGVSVEDERPLNGDRLAVRRVRGDLFWDASSFAVTSLRVRFAACNAARAFCSVYLLLQAEQATEPLGNSGSVRSTHLNVPRLVFCLHVSTQQLGDLVEMQQRACASSSVAMPSPHGRAVSSAAMRGQCAKRLHARSGSFRYRLLESTHDTVLTSVAFC